MGLLRMPEILPDLLRCVSLNHYYEFSFFTTIIMKNYYIPLFLIIIMVDTSQLH